MNISILGWLYHILPHFSTGLKKTCFTSPLFAARNAAKTSPGLDLNTACGLDVLGDAAGPRRDPAFQGPPTELPNEDTELHKNMEISKDFLELGVTPQTRWMVYVCLCHGKSQSKMDDDDVMNISGYAL